ncbi:DC-STAMP domain-containing protein 2-like [Cydia amplana]|uniref:DC-STAMP domain-containing protein 2-like n=1 Tax=Cydia amplana TaxID=1869771 RepID=UPI002FE6A998
MAYLALLWKAQTIEKYRLKYEKEKMNSIHSKKELRSTLYQKWTVYRNDSQKKFEQIYRSLCPEGSRLANSCTFLKENSSFILKIVIGIVGGILTYSLYTVFVCQLSVWSVLGWAIGLAITLGVVFSSTVRCLFLLLIPGLFSRVGRYTLACYALVLILTGPATNTLKNLDTLSASLACGQEHIKSSVKEIKESKESPLNLVQETMSGTIEKIQYLAANMKSLMVRIHRLAISIAHVLQSSLSWLNSIELTCNEKLGTPYEYCTKILAQGTEDCYEEFPELSNQWDWKVIVKAVCFNLKLEEPYCVVGDFAKGSIVATVKKKLNTYSTRLQSLLSVDIHIRRSHSCCNGSQPVSQAVAGVITDLRNRADTLLAWLSWTCALTGLFLMLIILRAKYYLHMFKTRSRFDNRYVTKELRELDLRRQRQGRETVLPLNTRERAKYVATSSIRLLPSERMYLTRSIVFMVITTLKLMIHMVADYSLYWVLMNVRFHGSEQSFQPTNRTERILVSGSGPLAATVRVVLEALSVPLILPAASTAGCLPDPHPPDLRRYAHIGTLILLLWLLALFEPYGLRLRHVISGRYEPERAKARAVWLYYHIIRTRSCFLKYARRKLHRQFKYMSEEKYTFQNLLNNCIPCQWLRTLLGVGPAELHCLLCCTKHRQEDLDRHLKRCETPSCPGVYCARCFMDIGQLCTICYSPEDYGDLSDVSLEKFASDDNSSDDSDYDGDDNIPLMGTQDYEINEDEKGTWSNRNKENNSSVFLYSRCRSGNEEATPLLDFDFLNKDYAQRGMIKMKCNNTFSTHKVDGDFPITSEAIFKPNQTDMTDEIIADKIVQNNEDKANLSPLYKSRKAPIVFGDTDVTVNGISFPKRKLGAIIKMMMLLTTKDENCNKYKRNLTTKHKPFEYLFMEMFQPSKLFHRISLARRNKRNQEINN